MSRQNSAENMAAKKTDSFFLRVSTAHGTTAGYEQESYDLGAYVDALGKSVLRIHNIQVSIQNTADPAKGPNSSSTVDLNVGWQLTTQSQSAFVLASDPSVASSGITLTAVDSSSQIINILNVNDVNPSMFTNGMLIAVDELYLGVDTTTTADAAFTTTLVMECTVEKMDERAAMALALSQSN